jgi:hypothetical protein
VFTFIETLVLLLCTPTLPKLPILPIILNIGAYDPLWVLRFDTSGRFNSNVGFNKVEKLNVLQFSFTLLQFLQKEIGKHTMLLFSIWQCGLVAAACYKLQLILIFLYVKTILLLNILLLICVV